MAIHVTSKRVRPGKTVYFPASWAKFLSSRADFPMWDGFPYVFLYFFLQVTKFPGKELPVLPVFFFFSQACRECCLCLYLASNWHQGSKVCPFLLHHLGRMTLLVIPCLFMQYEEILMVWVRITRGWKPSVIRTQTINIVRIAWEQTGGNEFITQ